MSMESIHYNENPKIQCYVATINYRMAHFHDDLEILYVLEGSVIIELKDKVHTLRAHDIFIIERGVVHSIRKTNEPHLLLNLQLSVSSLAGVSPTSLRVHLNQHLFTPGVGSPYQSLKSIFLKLLDNYTQPDSIRPLKNMQLICDIGILFYEKLDHTILPEHNLAQEEKNNILLSRLLNYIQQNYMYSPTLSEFGREHGLSVNYLSRFFKNSMGANFSRYLSSVRTRRAEYLITHSDKSLLDICIECGFSNSSVFNKAFFEDFGCRPSEYKNLPHQARLYFNANEPAGESQHIIAAPMRIREYLLNPQAAPLKISSLQPKGS